MEIIEQVDQWQKRYRSWRSQQRSDSELRKYPFVENKLAPFTAARRALPVVSIYKDFARSGGLSPNLDIVYRRAAHFVDKLIKGGQASELPVEQPVIFDVVINQRTAKALGIIIPQSVLIRADEVIE